MIDNVFLLGSECYTNIGLTDSNFASAKVRYSPFHGTRILKPLGVCPVADFFLRYSEFKKIYLDKSEWEWHVNKGDTQGWNARLNMRKCHLNKDSPFNSIDRTKEAFEFFEQNAGKCMFVLDLNDYMVLSDSALLELKQVVLDHNIVCAIRRRSMQASLTSIYTNIGLAADIRYLAEMQSKIIRIFNPVVLNNNKDYCAFFNKL